MTHSILAPSSAAGWMQCAAWPRMNAPYANDPPTPESLEGDAAHALANVFAINRDDNEHARWLGTTAPNGVTIDQDMIDGAQLFASVVGPGAVHETRVGIGAIHPHCFGTPDADRSTFDTLDVYDYKYGHRFVEVFENWQLIAYAVGVIDTRMNGYGPKTIRFTIVQPRAYHPDGPVRTWTCSIERLRELSTLMHARAHAAVDEAGTPRADAPATTGPECGDCRARHECTLFQSVAARIVDQTGRAERFNLPPAQLAAELSYLDESIERLEARRDGLAVQAETHIREGRAVPGYGMEPGRSNEKWRDGIGTAEVAALGSAFGVSLVHDPEPMTPTQARAALKRRSLPVDIVNDYAHRPPAALKFVRVSNIRARKAFGVASK